VKVNDTILIGGGSGLIGSRLTQLLSQKGHRVLHLGRKAKDGPVKTFEWDIHKQTIDERAFEGVSAVVNLAGANIDGQRWTEAYKRELAISRTGSTKLIVDFLNNKPHNIKHFISGSAIGVYGFGSESQWFREADPPGNDFLAQLVASWEHEASKLKNEDVKLAFVRTGIVFANKGGALDAMKRPIKLYAGAPLGSGKQLVSWIHIDDLSRIFIHILENGLAGAFNATAPDPASNERITKAIAKKLAKPLWLPNIPEFVLKIILGDMTGSVVNGSMISSEKIQSTGFAFQYPTLDKALGEVLG
jgi:uncharacterized protein (TIGR01777 family)